MEPIIQKFNTRDEAVVYFNTELNHKIYTSGHIGKGPTSKYVLNDNDSYIVKNRAHTCVWSCEIAYNNYIYALARRHCLLKPCDNSTLEWWLIYKPIVNNDD